MSTKLAQRYKRAKGRALRSVAQGRKPLRGIILDGHEALKNCPVHRVIQAAPGMGPKKTRKCLEAAHIWPLVGVGDLSDDERRRILDNLPAQIQ